MPSEKEFIINQYITVKLEAKETVIYIEGERFQQCKALLLNIPIDDLEKFSEIESIDEVAEMLNWDVDEGQEGVVYDIPPETEFFGHCSNLQAWYEHGYNINLLHTNLAFPLLQKLTDIGDPLAKKVFREEIIKKIASGDPSVIKFLNNQRYFDYLDDHDYNLDFEYPKELSQSDFFMTLMKIDNSDEAMTVYNSLLNKTLRDLLQTFYKSTLKLEDLLDVYKRIVSTMQGTRLIKENFLELLNMFYYLGFEHPKGHETYIIEEYNILINALKGGEERFKEMILEAFQTKNYRWIDTIIFAPEFLDYITIDLVKDPSIDFFETISETSLFVRRKDHYTTHEYVSFFREFLENIREKDIISEEELETFLKKVLDLEKMVSQKYIDDLFDSKARVKILKVFALNEEVTISILIKKTKLNHDVVTKHLKYLKDVDLVQEKKFGRIRVYRFKKESPAGNTVPIYLKAEEQESS